MKSPTMGQFVTLAVLKYLECPCAQKNIDRFWVNPGVKATWRSDSHHSAGRNFLTTSGQQWKITPSQTVVHMLTGGLQPHVRARLSAVLQAKVDVMVLLAPPLPRL